MGQDRKCRSHRADRASVDVGNAVPYREIIGEVARFEVVQAVHKDVSTGRVLSDVAMVEIVDDRRDAHGGVDLRESAPSGLRLGNGVLDILLVEQHLSLEIRDLDKIAVDDHQVPDTRTSEQFGGHAAECPAPEYECGRPVQPSLTLFPKTRKQRLAVVAGQVVTHGWTLWIELPWPQASPGFPVSVERVFPKRNGFVRLSPCFSAGQKRSVFRALEWQHRIPRYPAPRLAQRYRFRE